MADVRIKDLVTNTTPSASQYVATDLSTTQKLTIQALVDIGVPLASQAEAEAGIQATKRMTPLTTAQAITARAATPAQGALADSAVQPGDLSAVATTGNYNDLSDQPSLSADLIYPIKADAVAATIPNTENALRINGDITEGDGLGGLYIDSNNGNPDTLVSSGGTSRTWYRAPDVSATRLFGAPDIRNFLDTASYVPTRTAAKALDTTKETTLILTEAGREGIFNWKAGDYSAQITADTAEGVYLKANGVASSSGAWIRAYNGQSSPQWFGAVGDGATDDTGAINSAAAVAGSVGGGIVLISGKHYIAGTITVPHDVRIEGVSQNRDAWLKYPGFADNDDDRSHLLGNGLLIRSPASRILMGPNTSLKNVRTVGEWCTVPPRSDLDDGSILTTAMIAAWPVGSVGVEVGGNDVIIENNTIIGFQKGVVSSGFERARIIDNNIDSHTGIEVTAAGDVAHICGNQIFPLYPRDWPDSSGRVTQRLGRAMYLHDVADTAIVTNNFGYGFAIGLHLKDVYAIQAVGNRFDNSFLGQENYPMGETIGYLTEGMINSCFIDAALCDGYYINLKATHTDGHLSIGSFQMGSTRHVKAFIGKNASLSADRFVMAGDTTGALIEFEHVRTTEVSIREIVLAYFTGTSNIFSFDDGDVRKIHIGSVMRGGTATGGNVDNFPGETLEVVFSVSAGVVTVLGSKGISSVGRFSAGVFLINFANDQPDTVYSVEMSAQRGSSGHMICSLPGGTTNAKNVNNVQVTTVNPSNALEDPLFMSVTIKRI